MESSTTHDGIPRQCKASTKGGQPCQAWAIAGSEYCFSHAPELADRRKLARSRGGKARHGRTLGEVHDGAPVHIADLADVVTVLERELNALLTLEKSVQRARAVGYLCGVLVGVYKDSELAQRLEMLERGLADIASAD